MKRFLRVGEKYALSKRKPEYIKLRYISLLAVLTTMCLYAHAQRLDNSGPVPLGKMQASQQQGLVIGDNMPEWFWDIELTLVGSANSTFKLADHKNKLLVLDFWGVYCAPCIASINKWDTLQPAFAKEVAVVAIHVSYPERAVKPFVAKRDWQLPIALDARYDTLLNNLFYAEGRFGQVWIKDGKLFAIPKNSVVSKGLVADVVNGMPVEIEMEESQTYFDPALIGEKQ